MESILIVDDETIEREGIRDNLNWSQLGFDRVETAADGRQALQMVEQSPPSILLTDIRMPFMDGLELCKAVRVISPETKVIILTGHDEFPYAQEAVRLGASDLILKPVTAGELSKILESVRRELVAERTVRRDLDRLRSQMIESLPLLRERFLMRLLQDRVNQPDWHEQAATLGIDLSGDCWAVLAIRVDHWETVIQTRGYEQSELLLLAVEAISQEFAKPFTTCSFLRGGGNELLVILSSEGNGFDVDVPAYAQAICKTVAANLDTTVTVGVGRPTGQFAGLPNSYRDAIAALGYRLLLGGDRVVSIADLESHNLNPAIIRTEYSRRLATAVRTGAVSSVGEAVEDFIASLSANGVPVAVCRMIVMHAVTEILAVAYELGRTEMTTSDNWKLFKDLQGYETLSEIKAWLQNICLELARLVELHHESHVRLLIERAKAHVEEHYTNPDLSVQDLCRELHLSASYFSLVFKRETGRTFLGMLTDLRMNKAKELLLTSSLKGYEIAEQVGYSDPNYFSVSFRKHFGLSPVQYREQCGRDAI
jgi:two-component system, response regulator YesN